MFSAFGAPVIIFFSSSLVVVVYLSEKGSDISQGPQTTSPKKARCSFCREDGSRINCSRSLPLFGLWRFLRSKLKFRARRPRKAAARKKRTLLFWTCPHLEPPRSRAKPLLVHFFQPRPRSKRKSPLIFRILFIYISPGLNFF